MRGVFSTAVAIGVGIVVLLGYFFPSSGLVPLRETLINWAVIIAGAAGLVAILNLLGVHWRRLNSERNRDYYSIVLLGAFAITLIAGFSLGPADVRFQRVVNNIQMPIEASLMAVLLVTLTFASIRLFQHRGGWMAIVFAVSVVVFLVLGSGYLSLGNNLPVVKTLLYALNSLPIAGARGILLGVALGSLTTGLRILASIDRPYSG